MKKTLQLLLIFSVLMVTFSSETSAQKKKRSSKVDQYFDDKGSFTDRLWYGADFTLNFGSTGSNGTIFNAGIAPMAGYKITPSFSVGPRIEIRYRGERYDIGAQNDLKFNSTNYGVGLFSRLKIANLYFIHVEYQSLNEEIGVDVDINPTNPRVITARTWSDNFFVGGGYATGAGGVGFQATILWNTLESFDSQNVPIYYRLGITYKF